MARLGEDLRTPWILWLKAGLFLAAAIAACGGVLLEAPSGRVAFFLAVALWSTARAYYFAFYVIEHYVDSTHRFAGLCHFGRFAISRLLNSRSRPR